MRIFSVSPYSNANKNISKPRFKAKPLNLPYVEVKSSTDAMLLYNYLKNGRFLDTSDGRMSIISKNIRDLNFGFLKALKTDTDKKDFIKYFETVTGFPNLQEVSERIEREFVLSIKKSSLDCGTSDAECIAAGYDGICSVGKKMAFPGSDLDKAFIILRGSDNPNKDDEILNRFKSSLSANTDQRLLSFNHDISFPTVYTLRQIRANLEYINEITKNLEIDEEFLNSLMETEYKDLYKAAKYNRIVSQKFPIEKKNNSELSKEDVKNFGYIVEFIREGKYLINTPEFDNFKNSIKDYPFYKFTNVAQLRATKKAIDEGRENKTKILLRQQLMNDFKSWDISKQYDFIVNMIKYISEDNNEFLEYFKNDRDVREINKVLLNELARGDKTLNQRPDFITYEDHLEMQYATDKKVGLYKGYSENILWIDSSDSYAIEEVIRQLNIIRESDLFNNITKIQCMEPVKQVEGFRPIAFKTQDNKQIFERIIDENH